MSCMYQINNVRALNGALAFATFAVECLIWFGFHLQIAYIPITLVEVAPYIY